MRYLCIFTALALAAFALFLTSCSMDSAGRSGGAKRFMDAASVPPAAMVAEGPAGESSSEGSYDVNIQSGTLTAGSIDDSADPRFYHTWVRDLAQAGMLDELTGPLAQAPPLVVRVTGEDGKPLANALVKAIGGRGSLHLRTGSDGRCVILRGLGVPNANESFQLLAEMNQATAEASVTPEQTSLTLKLPTVGSAITALDLAFVIDCTGSMSDELEYLKVEVRDIARAIAQRYPKVTQRYALICYRDKGDEYVTRQSDFTDSIDAFGRMLGKQQANGGGDYPEAVDKALAEAGQLRWSSDPAAVRVVFHIADAPPHDDRAGDALDATAALQRAGVAVYPVASSGVGDAAEFVMRTEALMTGGQYLFLTDDSGVGNAHAEPHFPTYHVEKLKGLMIRMIASEISGQTLAPAPEDIIRTIEAKAEDLLDEQPAPQPGEGQALRAA